VKYVAWFIPALCLLRVIAVAKKDHLYTNPTCTWK
jgi:hypothetical protein